MNEPKTPLTSSEIGTLWTAYMNDSMSKQILDFMLKHLEDTDIKPCIQHAYNLSSAHLEKSESIFRNEQYVIPNGFTEQDVNMNASWLFTDTFCLTYVNHMTRVAMGAYSGFVAISVNEAI